MAIPVQAPLSPHMDIGSWYTKWNHHNMDGDGWYIGWNVEHMDMDAQFMKRESMYGNRV
jgi:hypothetical protein